MLDVTHALYFRVVYVSSVDGFVGRSKDVRELVVQHNNIHHSVLPLTFVEQPAAILGQIGVGLFLELANHAPPRVLVVVDSAPRGHPFARVSALQHQEIAVSVHDVHTGVSHGRLFLYDIIV